MSLLAVEELDVRHGLLQAVRGVSFAVEEGEILALRPRLAECVFPAGRRPGPKLFGREAVQELDDGHLDPLVKGRELGNALNGWWG